MDKGLNICITLNSPVLMNCNAMNVYTASSIRAMKEILTGKLSQK